MRLSCPPCLNEVGGGVNRRWQAPSEIGPLDTVAGIRRILEIVDEAIENS